MNKDFAEILGMLTGAIISFVLLIAIVFGLGYFVGWLATLVLGYKTITISIPILVGICFVIRSIF